MLEVKGNSRLTLDQALQHPWVQGTTASTSKLDDTVLQALKQFSYQCRLKKALVRAIVKNSTPQSQEHVRKHFNRLDKDGDGKLDVEELKALLISMGFDKNTSNTEAAEMLRQADENGDGVIEFEEFVGLWQRKLLSVSDKYMRSVFGILDNDNSGYIELNELKELLGEDQTQQSLVDMLQEVDVNKDGKISYDEFKDAMKEVIGFDGAIRKEFSSKKDENGTVG